jgi:hypothetical protein
MTLQVEQLALARVGFEITDDVSMAITDDLEQALWYARTQKNWSNGKPVTLKEQEAIFATEIVDNLGVEIINLANPSASLKQVENNPLYDDVVANLKNLNTLKAVSKDLTLLEEFEAPDMHTGESIDARFNRVFETYPEFMGEYWVKRCLALKIYKSKPGIYLEREIDAKQTLQTALETLSDAERAFKQV